MTEVTKPTESFPQTTLPVAHWQWTSPPQPCGRTSTVSCSVLLAGIPKQQGEHSMFCTGRIAGDSYTLILRLIPDTKVDRTKYLLSNPKHRGTATQHHVYGKVHLAEIYTFGGQLRGATRMCCLGTCQVLKMCNNGDSTTSLGPTPMFDHPPSTFFEGRYIYHHSP